MTGILGALMVLLGLHRPRQRCRSTSAGLLLIVFGIVLFGLELTVTSHGLLGVGGLVCFALGASALFTGPGDPFEPLARVAPATIIVIVRVTGRPVPGHDRARAVSARAAMGSRRARGPAASRPGTLGEVRSPLSPLGSVLRRRRGMERAQRATGGRSSAGRPFASSRLTD